MKKLISALLIVSLILTALPLAVSAAQNASGYNSSTVYYAGDTVTYNGIEYKAKWYTVGTAPGTQGSAWERVASYDASGNPIWYDGMIVTGGNKVNYNGSIYQAKWWTNTVPGSDSSWTLISGSGAGTSSGTDSSTPADTSSGTDISAPSDSSSGTDVSAPSDTSSGTDTSSPADTSSGTSSGSSSGTDGVLPYSPTTVYFAGNKVTYNGIAYTAKWYALGNTPGDPDGPWQQVARYDEYGLEVWYEGKVYTEGQQAYHNGILWQAKWWTNTEPGSDSSWKNMTNPGTDESSSDTDSSSGTDSSTDSGSGASAVTKYSDYTVDASLVANGNSTFRTVGYFPFYSASKADDIDYSCLTNLIYAFAFPDGNGGLQALDDTALVQKLIADGHAAGVQVQLGVGGWAYYGTIEEYQFDGCTATPALIDKFTDAIVALVNQYGFDGVDVDWEHPRFGTDSYKHYEAMMISLRQKLGNEKLLTSAVLSGVTTNGTVYYDAAAHTANVMAVCNWFNVMAYDCECTLDFDKSCADYWCVTRGMPANKVCMGVPFYTYPGWTTYADLLASDPSAATDDMAGTSNYHNSPATIKAKVNWAENYGLGGLMIWEISQDTTDKSASLLSAIHSAIG
ncbi:MAG TPA: glycosyl hydrolase family 18 protein [Lachnospiraceae bacterium]|nr:glycosyl hydrolase family 18 protein [Lachnospiraceae bacterium]